eukprot:TRINITY_DN16992_c0_g1_i4.p1 TRINITY_DN16992_c0_g1~~TRINITY_DN16992_c0_g1_i4.p1  ORF type:complete len:614 (-),score=108.24 TRINITY_DN16992_c0_g1_i4:86-1927(-)
MGRTSMTENIHEPSAPGIDGPYDGLYSVLHAMRTELLFFAFLLAIWLTRYVVQPEKPKQPKLQKAAGQAKVVKTPTQASTTAVVSQLKRLQDTRGLDLYKTAMESGSLDLRKVAKDDISLITSQLVAAAVRGGREAEALQIFSDLRSCGLKIEEGLLTSALKLCASRSLFDDCLSLYDYVVADGSLKLTDRSAWSSLLYCALEANQTARCMEFYSQLKRCATPSAKDFGSMLRVAQVDGDCQLAIGLLDDLPSAGIEASSIYNSVLSICCEREELDAAFELLDRMEDAPAESGIVADTITYNVLMKACARSGDVELCRSTFERMRHQGVTPSSVTYGILLDGVINSTSASNAIGVIFDQILTDGCQLNTVLCTTLIKGFTRAGELDRALEVYSLMKKNSEMLPDMVTYSTLIKGLCDDRRLETALQLLQEMREAGLAPDEVVYNSLFSGCRMGGNIQLCKKLYSVMVSSGIKPTDAIFSNLICLYAQCRCLGEAIELLSREPVIHGVVPAPRVFVQLISSCIRERQGRRAIHCYDLLTSHHTPQADAHHTMLNLCLRLNMFDTAAAILVAATRRGAPVDGSDVRQVVETATRKQKAHHVQCIQELVSEGKLTA